MNLHKKTIYIVLLERNIKDIKDNGISPWTSQAKNWPMRVRPDFRCEFGEQIAEPTCFSTIWDKSEWNWKWVHIFCDLLLLLLVSQRNWQRCWQIQFAQFISCRSLQRSWGATQCVCVARFHTILPSMMCLIVCCLRPRSILLRVSLRHSLLLLSTASPNNTVNQKPTNNQHAEGMVHTIHQGEGGEQGDPFVALLFLWWDSITRCRHEGMRIHERLDIWSVSKPDGDLHNSVERELFGRARLRIHWKTHVWNRSSRSHQLAMSCRGEPKCWMKKHVCGQIFPSNRASSVGVPSGSRGCRAEATLRNTVHLFQAIPSVPDIQSWLLLFLLGTCKPPTQGVETWRGRTFCQDPRCESVAMPVWHFAMDLAYMCVKPQMRLYVCQALPLPNTKCVYMCVTKCVYMCVTKCAYTCVTKCVFWVRNGARFARLPLLASLARCLTV